MLAGLIASTVKLFVFPEVVDIHAFPAILLVSFIGSFVGTYLSPLENREEVKQFYKQTRPWGFWGPIRREVMQEDPAFVPNRDFRRDVFNVVVGIIWQMAQVVIPIYFMIHENGQLMIWGVVFLVTSWLLKKYWWDRLNEVDADVQSTVKNKVMHEQS